MRIVVLQIEGFDDLTGEQQELLDDFIENKLVEVLGKEGFPQGNTKIGATLIEGPIQRSRAKPTGPKPTGAKPTGARPTGARPTGAKPTKKKPHEKK